MYLASLIDTVTERKHETRGFRFLRDQKNKSSMKYEYFLRLFKDIRADFMEHGASEAILE